MARLFRVSELPTSRRLRSRKPSKPQKRTGLESGLMKLLTADYALASLTFIATSCCGSNFSFAERNPSLTAKNDSTLTADEAPSLGAPPGGVLA